MHERIVKRGVDHWIGLQERNGINLYGRILSIGDGSFVLQLHNDPQTTEIFYSDVAYLGTHFNTGQKIFMIVGIGVVAGLSAWGFAHVRDEANKSLNPPTSPAFP